MKEFDSLIVISSLASLQLQKNIIQRKGVVFVTLTEFVERVGFIVVSVLRYLDCALNTDASRDITPKKTTRTNKYYMEPIPEITDQFLRFQYVTWLFHKVFNEIHVFS